MVLTAVHDWKQQLCLGQVLRLLQFLPHINISVRLLLQNQTTAKSKPI